MVDKHLIGKKHKNVGLQHRDLYMHILTVLKYGSRVGKKLKITVLRVSKHHEVSFESEITVFAVIHYNVILNPLHFDKTVI